MDALIQGERARLRPWAITILVFLDLLFALQVLFLGLMLTWTQSQNNVYFKLLMSKMPLATNYSAFLSFIIFFVAGISLWRRKKWSRYIHFLLAGLTIFGWRSILSLDTLYIFIVIFWIARMDKWTKAYFQIK